MSHIFINNIEKDRKRGHMTAKWLRWRWPHLLALALVAWMGAILISTSAVADATDTPPLGCVISVSFTISSGGPCGGDQAIVAIYHGAGGEHGGAR